MTEGRAIRVVVADDQTTIREALAMMLDLFTDLDVVGAAADGAAAVALVLEHRPDVLLTDLRMPGTDGEEATRQVVAQAPETAVVLLTTFDDEASILGALQAGARGYLTKDASRDDIAAAIRAAAAGQSVLDPAVQARLVQAALGGGPAVGSASGPGGGGGAAEVAPPSEGAEPTPSAVPDGLTPREVEVLGLIAQGLSNHAIAGQLFVSEATVKTHINNLFAKAGLRDRGHAVSYAYAHGLAG